MTNKLQESIEKIVVEAQKKGISVTKDELIKIVKTHAAGATASVMALVSIPGAGTAVASVVETGFVWSMYYRLCRKLGLSVKKELLKAIGSAIVADVAGSIAIQLITGTILASVPDIGTVGAMALVGLTGYCVL